MAKIVLNLEDWKTSETEFADFLSGLCSPPDMEPTEVWGEKNVIVQDGPFAGSNWRLQFTMYAKFIFAAMRTPGMKRVVIMMCAQYVKTTALFIDFLRNVKEDPADTMWVMAEADHMNEFIQKRLMPYIEGCDAVAKLLHGRSKNLIQFEGMNVLLRGSNSRAKLQSDPIRRIYCDERREWKKGSIDLLRKRMRTFPNAMEVSAGTAGDENDELHIDYDEGTQTRAHYLCPKCNHSQPIRFGREATAIWKTAREFGGFRWDTNEVTKPGGVWNYGEVMKTVYFECENADCKHRITNAEKYEFIRTMHTHNYNPNATPGHASFSGCAFEAVWESCDWDKLVVEFLKAVEQAKQGNTEPLKAFITETLGEPWQDRLGVIEDAGFLEARKFNYNYGDIWPEAKRRFMAADVQERGGEHYPYVIREFADSGKSRLVSHGQARTLAELEKIRQDFKIGPTSALIDSGYKAQEIYRFCVSCNWKAFKGESRDYFLISKPHPKNPNVRITARQIWNKTVAVVYNPQTRAKVANIPLYMHCNNATNDLLAEYTKGLLGEWTLPAVTAKDFIQQMVGDVRREVTDSKGVVSYQWFTVGPNHLRDCCRMILIAAIITGVLAPPPPPKVAEKEKPEPEAKS